jgi:aromatic-L-amino-acid/L-tryptophan decarboxylase
MSEPEPETIDVSPPHMSSAELRRRGHEAVDLIADYLEQMERGVGEGGWPVQSRAVPGAILSALPASPPQAPGGGGAADAAAWFAGVQRDMREIILPGLTHWQSPRFFGYFPCNASGPAMIAEILCAGLNANGFLWATSPAITELEMRMMDWMAEAIGLPAGFRFDSGSEDEPARGGGVIQGTASESTLVAMLAGRQRAVSAGADPASVTVYASEEAHSSVLKAAMVAGLASGPEDRSRVRLIPVDEMYAMDAHALRAAIEADRAAGLVPAYVCATVGTTGSTAIDPVVAIADVLDADAQKHGGAGGAKAWLHVDAAHAAAACVAPEFRWLLRGVERADSLCFNPHKWLLTTFDCDCFWTQDRAALNQSLSVTPEYLRNAHSDSGAVVDYRDWQIPLGRRFRALKLWLVMTWYGLEGLRAHVRRGVRQAEHFEQWVRADDRFEMMAPRTLNLVCFRLKPREGEGGAPEACDRRNRLLLDAVNASGRALLTHTTLPRGGSGARGGRRDFTLRMAIGGTLTEERHVRETWELIQELAE